MSTLGWMGAPLVLGIALSAGALGAQQSSGAPADSSCGDSAAPIQQEIDLPASPERAYRLLLDAHDFAAFSGRPATIDSTVGGAFSLFNAHIVGRNLELVPGCTTTWPPAGRPTIGRSWTGSFSSRAGSAAECGP